MTSRVATPAGTASLSPVRLSGEIFNAGSAVLGWHGVRIAA